MPVAKGNVPWQSTIASLKRELCSTVNAHMRIRQKSTNSSNLPAFEPLLEDPDQIVQP